MNDTMQMMATGMVELLEMNNKKFESILVTQSMLTII